MRTQVLVVGAGPVGLTAAMDLASRGIDVVVAEIRHAGDPPSVKCNHVSARSMEIFRRLGVAAKLRDAGLPADFPNDCAYRTTATGIELCRIEIPGRATPLQRHRRPRHMVADAGAAAPDQPGLSRADPVQPCRRPAAHHDSGADRDRGDRAGRTTRWSRSRAISTAADTFRIAASFVDRMRRQPLAGAQVDRRESVGDAGDPARAVDLYRGAASSRS